MKRIRIVRRSNEGIYQNWMKTKSSHGTVHQEDQQPDKEIQGRNDAKRNWNIKQSVRTSGNIGIKRQKFRSTGKTKVGRNNGKAQQLTHVCVLYNNSNNFLRLGETKVSHLFYFMVLLTSASSSYKQKFIIVNATLSTILLVNKRTNGYDYNLKNLISESTTFVLAMTEQTFICMKKLQLFR